MRMRHLLAAVAALTITACAAEFEARTDFGPDSGLDGLGAIRVLPSPEAPHGRAKGRADGTIHSGHPTVPQHATGGRSS